MGESRIQNAFSRSAVFTVGRLVAFIVVGFAVGLGLGVVTEEPGLLAGHLRGETTTVDLDAVRAAQVEARAEAARAEAARAAAEEGWVAGAVDAAPLVLEDGEAVADDDAAGLPSVSAGPEADEGGSAAASAGVDVRKSAPPLQELPVTTPPAGGRFAIQVGAFGDEPSADRLARQLEGKGYPIEILPAGDDSNRWRVRVQPIGDERTARSTAERIEREERLPTWVIRLEGQKRS
jgi:cell division septation protein DedD